jgi:hypothetical protein
MKPLPAFREYLIAGGVSEADADTLVYFVERDWIEIKSDGAGGFLWRASKTGVLALWHYGENLIVNDTIH